MKVCPSFGLPFFSFLFLGACCAALPALAASVSNICPSTSAINPGSGAATETATAAACNTGDSAFASVTGTAAPATITSTAFGSGIFDIFNPGIPGGHATSKAFLNFGGTALAQAFGGWSNNSAGGDASAVATGTTLDSLTTPTSISAFALGGPSQHGTGGSADAAATGFVVLKQNLTVNATAEGGGEVPGLGVLGNYGGSAINTSAAGTSSGNGIVTVNATLIGGSGLISGADATLNNAVSGSTQGGTLILNQSASGGGSYTGTIGKGASLLSYSDITSKSFTGTSLATGQIGTATISLQGAHIVVANATVQNQYVIGATGTASARAESIGLGSKDGATANATFFAGGGASSISSATAFASAAGAGNATANVTQFGGAASDFPSLYHGGDSTLDNAVSGTTNGGTLRLQQKAIGGQSGQLGTGDFGGNATSTLTFAEFTSKSIFAETDAQGSNGAAGITTTAAIDVHGAHNVYATANANLGSGSGLGNFDGFAGSLATAHAAATTDGLTLGDTATAEADVTGGSGGAVFYSANTARAGDGASLTNEAVASAVAIGSGNAQAIARQQGGTGGSVLGFASKDAGWGGSSVLIDAVSGSTIGGTLTLQQSATGGDGGVSLGVIGDGSDAGASGNGGYARSDLTFVDGSSATLTGGVSARGGASGAFSPYQYLTGQGGDGGSAEASLFLHGQGVVTGTADTYGQGGGAGVYANGLGGFADSTSVVISTNGPTMSTARAYTESTGTLGNNAGGQSGEAIATSTATSLGMGAGATATAIARSQSGVDFFGNGVGSAWAGSTASTANGQLATALSTGSGVQGFLTGTATTHQGTRDMVSATATALTAPNQTSVQAQVDAKGPLFAFDSTGQNSYASATLLPTPAVAAAAVAAASNAELVAALKANPLYLGIGTQGGLETNSGLNEFTSSIVFNIDTIAHPLTGNLILGFLGTAQSGNGFDQLTFSVTEALVNLILEETITFDMWASNANDGFGVSYLFADPQPFDLINLGPNFSETFYNSNEANAFFSHAYDLGSPVAPSTGVPEPLTISLFGAGLAGILAMRRRPKKVSRSCTARV